MPFQLDAVRAFLRRPGLEGPQLLRGYIPCTRNADGRGRNYIGPCGGQPCAVPFAAQGPPDRFTAMGVSGVTIATGVDLGQSGADELARAGVPVGIVNMLRPYLGLKRDAALQKLHALPLCVAPEVAEALDGAVLSLHASRIAARYRRDNPKTPFEDLPAEAQAVIFSLLYQRGSGAADKAPRTWDAFLRGDWQDASRRLRNPDLWDAHKNRRRLEGEHLRRIA